jgi:SpoIID/LytB domain protein
MKAGKKWLSAALVLALIWPQGMRARAAADGSVIRVLLTALRLTDRVDIALDGSYETRDGMAFQRGSKLTVASTTGTLMLYYEGMAMDAGQELILYRHASEGFEENGVRINGGYALYAGDLYLAYKDGMLRAVLHIPVEEYLLGVVPYEMSDSFPMEALKAQAVAARTYALSHTGRSGDYDVTDSTLDQVYKGFNRANANAVAAVAGTAGVCGYYKGGYAVCYYTASNGGQTELAEHVWGAGDFGYLAMTDDPYDLENDESVKKSFTLSSMRDATSQGIYALLDAKLTAAMTAMGYDAKVNRFRAAGIVSVSAHTPRYAPPSRLMTLLGCELKVERSTLTVPSQPEEEILLFSTAAATASPAPTEAPAIWSPYTEMTGTVPVDLDLFLQVEQAAGLSINGSDNELITVTAVAGGFKLESRRYGHGVGMSQRGAQRMAQGYGKTYQEILAFYYPGITLGVMAPGYTPRPALSAQFLSTPGPAATPTPRPTLMPVQVTPGPGEYRVKVTLIGEDSSLNLRDAPGTYGGIVRPLYYGQELVVMGEEADGWIKVRTDAVTGYVMSKFVEKVTP